MPVLKVLVGLISVFWLAIVGGYAEYRWERRPAGWPNYEVRVLFVHKHFGFGNGLGAQLAALQDAEKKAGERAVRVVTQIKTITVQAAKAEDIAQAKIRVVYRDKIREVTTYVTPESDRAFPLSVGFVRVLDAGALGLDVSKVPGPAGQPDDSAHPVAPSVVAASAVDDFGICAANAERLSAVQDYIRQTMAVFNQ